MNDVIILFNPHDGDVESEPARRVRKGWVVTLTTADPIIGEQDIGETELIYFLRSLALLSAKGEPGNKGE